MSEEIKMNWSTFEAALARRAATSTRDHLALATQQMRGLMREVVKITPPGHSGLEGGTKLSLEHGRAKVAADIKALYGTPNDAYERLALVSKAGASAFWFMRSKGDEAAAAELFKAKTGDWYGPFDGGKIHGTHFKGGKVRKRRGRPIIYISDPKALEDYIAEKQGDVMHLTAGWKDAFAKLGIALPQFVSRLSAPGSMLIDISDQRIRFVATDAVSYAAATGLQRRIQAAIDAQTAKMQREWDNYMQKLNQKAGL